MPRSRRSILFATVILCLVVFSVPATPAQAADPGFSRDAHTEIWLDFSFAAWIDELVDRLFGEPTETVVDGGPDRVSDRIGSHLDPDGSE